MATASVVDKQDVMLGDYSNVIGHCQRTQKYMLNQISEILNPLYVILVRDNIT